jgi:hypothetical protein
MKDKVKVYTLEDLGNNRETILCGTINDIRQWAKDQWKSSNEFVKDLMIDLGGILNEEDFYTKMDDDLVLLAFLQDGGYILVNLCEVPLDDFYDEGKASQELIDEVIEEIKRDISSGDLTALDELLKAIPLSYLNGYLPEK